MKRSVGEMEEAVGEVVQKTGHRLSAKQALRQMETTKRAKTESEKGSSKQGKSGTATPSVRRLVWRNKQRTLMMSNRQITSRYRHLQQDLVDLLPHSKKDAKLDSKDEIRVANEIAEMRDCTTCIFFECRKHTDLYMWVSKTPNGPSAKFLVSNVHTMAEMKLIGNCLKGSRHLMCFDAAFESQPHLALIKELLSQSFGVPAGHPKSKPFVDHILSFHYLDDRIWFRNFQIIEKQVGKNDYETELMETGPRFVLTPIRILAGSFGGPTLYQNPEYVSPNMMRSMEKRRHQDKYKERVEKTRRTRVKERRKQLPLDTVDDLYVEMGDMIEDQF